MKQYKVIILPEIPRLDEKSLQALYESSGQGTNLIATNRSLSAHPDALLSLFGAKAAQVNHDGAGFYLHPENKDVFKRLNGQSLLFWKFNLGLYDFPEADSRWLPVYTPGRPGPPESIGGHEPSGHFAVGIKHHSGGKAALLPANVGKLYYIHGYEQHKNIVLDLIDHVYPEANAMIRTNAPPRVEVILQNFRRNTPANLGNTNSEGMILHLVNLTGFSGNTYFDALPVYALTFDIKCPEKPARIFSMVREEAIEYSWSNGRLKFTLDNLNEFDGIAIEYP
jgi:hypothetical protein